MKQRKHKKKLRKQAQKKKHIKNIKNYVSLKYQETTVNKQKHSEKLIKE